MHNEMADRFLKLISLERVATQLSGAGNVALGPVRSSIAYARDLFIF